MQFLTPYIAPSIDAGTVICDGLNVCHSRCREGDTAALRASQISTQMFTIMVTGAETTASAITFTLYHVAANSAAEEKVLREVDDFGRNSRFGYDDLGKVQHSGLTLNMVTCCPSDRIYGGTCSISNRWRQEHLLIRIGPPEISITQLLCAAGIMKRLWSPRTSASHLDFRAPLHKINGMPGSGAVLLPFCFCTVSFTALVCRCLISLSIEASSTNPLPKAMLNW